MKKQIDKKLFSIPYSAWIQLLFWIIPSLLWWGATAARSSWIHPSCLTTPQTCTKESVLKVDQLSLGMEDWKADEYSYWTQNFAGTLAGAVPMTWHSALFLLRRCNSVTAVSSAFMDLLILGQTIAWNGLLTETSHLISQRPRPFVYQAPLERGIDPAHYTSFYSGHTSFTAATTFAIFLILLYRGAPQLILCLSAITFETLVLSTAYFRILAGRHFLTDVICGAIAGSLTAWMILQLHRQKNPHLF